MRYRPKCGFLAIFGGGDFLLFAPEWSSLNDNFSEVTIRTSVLSRLPSARAIVYVACCFLFVCSTLLSPIVPHFLTFCCFCLSLSLCSLPLTSFAPSLPAHKPPRPH
jgi:hypothetical protein